MIVVIANYCSHMRFIYKIISVKEIFNAYTLDYKKEKWIIIALIS